MKTLTVVVVASTQIAHPAPRVAHRLRCRNHVEWNGQRASLVDVVQPKLRACKLPLDVAVLLHIQLS